MAEIELEVCPLQGTVLSGESLAVDTVIRNHQAAPLQVPGEHDPSDSTFHLEPADPNQRAYILSQRQLIASLSRGHTAIPRVMDPTTLPPGAWTKRPEEIATYHPRPLLAGSYQVSVSQTHGDVEVKAAPAAVQIVVPRPLAHSAQTCKVMGTRASVLAHLDDEGGATLLQRESRIGRPQHSVFFRRDHIDEVQNHQPISVSTVVKVVNTRGEGRWFGWLEPAGLAAHYAFGARAPLRCGPAAMDLQDARLLPVGFETEAWVGLFYVLGLQNGQSVLRAYRASRDKLAPGWQAPFGPAIPPHVMVRYEPSDAGDRLILVWVERQGGRSRVLSLDYSADGGRLNARPRSVAEFSDPVVAMDLAPVPPGDAAGDPPPLHVLTGPGPNARMTYHQFRLDAATTPPPLTFWHPPHSVDLWAITATGAALPVAAQAGPRLLVKGTAGQGWLELANHLPSAQQLEVYTIDGQDYYVGWLDSTRGFRLRQL